MRQLILFFVIMLTAGLAFGEKVVTLPELLRPKTITLDNDQIYIGDDATVFVYSRNDYKLVTKFGKKGGGPQEFMVGPNAVLRIKRLPDGILVNSLNKISFYTKKGEYIKEKKHSIMAGAGELFPLGDQFVAMNFALDNKQLYFTANIFDAELNKTKELTRVEFVLKGQQVEVLQRAIYLEVGNDKIFVTGEKGFTVEVYDKTGKKLHTISQDYEQLKFTDADKEEILNFYKTNPDTRAAFEQIKSALLFPDRFPEIRSFHIDGKKLYVQTYKRENGKTEFYVFDISDNNGKLIKKVWLPIVMTIPLNQLQLFSITDNKLYQVVENEDEEEWELHVAEIE